MTTFHAVVWLDHNQAQVVQFDDEHVQTQRVKAHHHHTRQHGDDARFAKVYFGGVARSLAGVHEVLVVGPGQARDEFRKYCDEHRKDIARCIVDSQPVDHPSEHQLVALARRYFHKYDLMAGTPTPA
jgi:stalled ribosome rescue protein Dom34